MIQLATVNLVLEHSTQYNSQNLFRRLAYCCIAVLLYCNPQVDNTEVYFV